MRHKIFLFIGAFILRLVGLGQSLWLDEATTAIAVQKYDWLGIISRFSPTDFHPPFYYLFMDVWTNWFGYSEITLRMPSVFFSLLAGWMVYKIVASYELRPQKGSDPYLGFWVAALFLFNPLIVYYSQEARMYSMVTFTVAVSFYYLIKIISYELRITNIFQNKDFWLMNLFMIVSFYTFYASIFFIATVWLYLIFKKRNRIALFSILVFSFAILPLLPLASQQFQNSYIALQVVANWSLVLGRVSLKNLALIPIKFTSGRISFEPKIVYYLLAGGWMMFVGIITVIPVILKLLRPNGSRIQCGMTCVLLFFFLTPLLLGTIFSFFSPLLQYFRFQYLIVFLSMILGYSIRHPELDSGSIDKTKLLNRFRNKFGMTRYILISGFAIWSLVYVLFPQFHREDWKSLSQKLSREKSPVYMIPSSADPLRYYSPEIKITDLRSAISDKTAVVNLPGKFIIIPYTADIHGVDYTSILSDEHFQIANRKNFRGLNYEIWEKINKNSLL